MSGNYNKIPELTAEKAYKHYHDDGLSYQQIADKYSKEDTSISHVTVRNRVQSFKEGKSTGIEEVKNNPDNFDLKSDIQDEPDDNNPYETFTCPNCGEKSPKPDTSGNHNTDCCGVVLNWDKSEL